MSYYMRRTPLLLCIGLAGVGGGFLISKVSQEEETPAQGGIAPIMDSESAAIEAGQKVETKEAVVGEPQESSDAPASTIQTARPADVDDSPFEEFDTKAKSKAVVRLVKKGVEYLTKNTENAAFQAINTSKEFIDGELYLFVYDSKGVVLAHGQQSELIWQNMYNVKDIYGVPFIQEIIQEGIRHDHDGWVTYQWRGATKISYVEKVTKGDKTFIVGSGYYPHSKMDAVVNLVKGAVTLFNDTLARGRPKDEALSALSYPLGRFVSGDLYLYALSFDGLHVAHGDLPGVIGTNGWEYRDTRGKFVNQEIIQKLKEKGSGVGVWVDYVSRNAPKKTYAERIVDEAGKEYFIACGYYPTANRTQVIDLVKKGYQFMKANGRTESTKQFSDQRSSDFRYGDLFLFVYDMNGICVAHGGNPAFVGTNQLNLKDEDGLAFIREFIKRAQDGGGWVNYKERHSFKSSYVEKITLGTEDYVIGSGLFPVSKYETMLLLAKSGADYLKTHKEEDAFCGFVNKEGKFVRGDLYIFALGVDGICFAYGPDQPDLIWRNLMNIRDENGKAYIKAFINKASRGPGSVRYKLNGVERTVYVEPVQKDGTMIIVGSGFFH